jgi:hypothetical protein
MDTVQSTKEVTHPIPAQGILWWVAVIVYPMGKHMCKLLFIVVCLLLDVIQLGGVQSKQKPSLPPSVAHHLQELKSVSLPFVILPPEKGEVSKRGSGDWNGGNTC